MLGAHLRPESESRSGVRVKVKVEHGVSAEARSTQSGQGRRVSSISHLERLPPCWDPRRTHGGSGSLEKEEGSYSSWRPGHIPPPHPKQTPPSINLTILTLPAVLATGWGISSSSFS